MSSFNGGVPLPEETTTTTAATAIKAALSGRSEKELRVLYEQIQYVLYEHHGLNNDEELGEIRHWCASLGLPEPMYIDQRFRTTPVAHKTTLVLRAPPLPPSHGSTLSSALWPVLAQGYALRMGQARRLALRRAMVFFFSNVHEALCCAMESAIFTQATSERATPPLQPTPLPHVEVSQENHCDSTDALPLDDSSFTDRVVLPAPVQLLQQDFAFSARPPPPMACATANVSRPVFPATCPQAPTTLASVLTRAPASSVASSLPDGRMASSSSNLSPLYVQLGSLPPGSTSLNPKADVANWALKCHFPMQYHSTAGGPLGFRSVLSVNGVDVAEGYGRRVREAEVQAARLFLTSVEQQVRHA